MKKYPFPSSIGWKIRFSGATILAYLFFGETVSAAQGLGMVLIFAAIAVASRKGRKEPEESRLSL